MKGFVDFIFEHEGRTYFGDWKTDRLPASGTPPRSRRTSTPTTGCKSGCIRWRWRGCSASPTPRRTRPASAARSTSSCAACHGRRRSAVAARASTRSERWQHELAGTLAGEARRERARAHAGHRAWARALVRRRTPRSEALYLAAEAGGWPARSRRRTSRLRAGRPRVARRPQRWRDPARPVVARPAAGASRRRRRRSRRGRGTRRAGLAPPALAPFVGSRGLPSRSSWTAASSTTSATSAWKCASPSAARAPDG